MSTDVTITLERVHCVREADRSNSGTEPYIWPALFYIDDDSLSQGNVIGQFSDLDDARERIFTNMRQGDDATIPAHIGQFQVRFDTGLLFRQIILVVAMLEEDDTPPNAIQGGYLTFCTEMEQKFEENLTLFFDYNDASRTGFFEDLNVEVIRKVRTKVGNLLLPFNFGLRLDTDDGDDYVDTKHIFFGVIENREFEMHLQNENHHYILSGRMEVRENAVQFCSTEKAKVLETVKKVEGLQSLYRSLKAKLRETPTHESKAIRAQVKQVLETDLPAATSLLKASRKALSNCARRKGFKAPLIGEFGLKSQI